MVADGRTINGRTSADHEPVELSGVLGSGKVYRAAVLDAFSRRIVGWSIADHMGTELVTDALGMAILRQYPSEKDPDNPTVAQRITVHNTRVRRGAKGSVTPECSHRWIPSVIATTMR